MQLFPRLCMATGNAGAGVEGESNGDKNCSSNNKLATAVSSSSSTVSTSSSAAAAAAAVSEASSSTSLPSLPSLSVATNTSSLSVSFAHVTTLLPLSTAASAAAVAAVDSAHGLVVARPASVSLHDLSTLEATSTSDSADAAAAAGSVKCVAHLHGGAAAVTGHQDGRLRLWRASTRAPARLRLAAALPTVSDRLRRFPVPSNHVAVRRHHRRLWIEHADAVSGVAAAADGRLLFSVSWDKTLKVWALPSLRCLQSLPAHDDAVNAVAVAPDGTVYTGSADRRVRVWAPRHPPPPSGRRASRGSSKKPVYHLVATLSRHTAAVNALAVGCGGAALYSGGNDRSVVVWEREDSASHMVAVGALRGHRKAVLTVACAAGGLVVSGSADNTVRAWRRAADVDGRGYACVAVIDGHGAAVRSVAAAPALPAIKQRRGDGGDEQEWRVCSASFDGEVRVWSLRVASGL